MKSSQGCLEEDQRLKKAIKSFRRDWSILEDNPLVLKRFYDYVSLRFSINCEKKMVAVERLLFCDSLEKFKSKDNTLLSSKILLYSWLEPVHLSVTQIEDKEQFVKAVSLLKDVKKEQSVSEMVFKYLETVGTVYKAIGKSRDHSTFFSVFILVIIKTQETSLDKLLLFMEKFRRSPLTFCEKCRKDNKHLEEGEVNYYLTVLRAALDFIEKMEFYDLNISQEEFNLKMK